MVSSLAALKQWMWSVSPAVIRNLSTLNFKCNFQKAKIADSPIRAFSVFFFLAFNLPLTTLEVLFLLLLRLALDRLKYFSYFFCVLLLIGWSTFLTSIASRSWSVACTIKRAATELKKSLQGAKLQPEKFSRYRVAIWYAMNAARKKKRILWLILWVLAGPC